MILVQSRYCSKYGFKILLMHAFMQVHMHFQMRMFAAGIQNIDVILHNRRELSLSSSGT